MRVHHIVTKNYYSKNGDSHSTHIRSFLSQKKCMEALEIMDKERIEKRESNRTFEYIFSSIEDPGEEVIINES